MPDPEPRSVPSKREVPANLDLLIRKALKGGDTRQLENVLSDTISEQPETRAPEVIHPSKPVEQPPTPFAVPADLQDESEDPPTDEVTPPVHQEAEAETSEAPIDPMEAALVLWDQADQTLQRLREGDLQAAHEALDEVMRAVELARIALPDRDSWEVQLPNYTKPYGLVIEGLGGPAKAPALAEALGLDLATARLNAVSHWSRTARRANNRAMLEEMAGNAHAGGIRAVVIDRTALLKAPTALWVMGRLEGDRWLVCNRTPDSADLTRPALWGTTRSAAIALRWLSRGMW